MSAVRRRPCSQLPTILRTSTTGATASSAATTTAVKVSHLPPLVVRLGIISTAVGLATPLFATAGVVRVWYSYMPRTVAGKYLKYLISVFGGGGGISLLYNYVLPFLRDHSNFVLPFALANGVASGFWYLVGEAAFGLPFMAGVVSIEALKKALPPIIIAIFTTPAGVSLLSAGLPVGGVVIGVLTAITAPIIWPLAFSICWDENLQSLILDGDSLWLMDLYNYFGIPVGIPVGAISGLSMHFALKSSITGSAGVPWTSKSLPVLAALVGASSIYFYIFRTPSSDFTWEHRMDPSTGEIVSYNPVTNAVQKDLSYADNAEMQRTFAIGVHGLRNPLRFIQNAEKSMNNSMSKNKNKLSETPPSYYEKIRNRKAIYGVTDLLVRLKYLSLHGGSREDIEALKRLAASSVGILDLEGFLKAVELAIIAQRRQKAIKSPEGKISTGIAAVGNPSSGYKSTVNTAMNGSVAVAAAGGAVGGVVSGDGASQLSESTAQLSESPAQLSESTAQLSEELMRGVRTFVTSTNRGDSIDTFLRNLPELEKELFEKIQYRIADTPGKEEDMLNAYRSARTYYRVAVAVGGGIVATGVVALVLSFIQ